jgi:two-component system sensor histidine kinase/response regulator
VSLERAASNLETVPGFEGLDAAAGLRRVGGNRGLYMSLLRQFAEKEALAGMKVTSALAAGDYAGAERIAHTVKGVAGNVGFTGLQSVAAALEKAIKGRNGLDDAVRNFETSLARSVAALRGVMRGEGSQPPAAAAVASNEHVGRLAALLARSDGGAVDFLLEHRPTVRAVFSNGQYEAFENAVKEFDFEAALETLRLAAAQRGVALLESSS